MLQVARSCSLVAAEQLQASTPLSNRGLNALPKCDVQPVTSSVDSASDADDYYAPAPNRLGH